jgi:streptogramin lyase
LIAEGRVEDFFLKVWKRYGSSALLVAVVVVSILSLSQVQASLFTEWTIPTSASGPEGIFVDGGLVYFTEASGNKIGRLDPSTGVFTEWTIPTSSSEPNAIFVSGA